MFCSNCGKEVLKSAKFCPHCGNKVETKTEKKEVHQREEASSRFKSDSPETETAPSSEVLTKLQKRYKDTGNTSIILSVLGIILSFGLSLIDYGFEETLIGVVIFLPLFAPFYHFGKKLKDKGIGDPSYALKVSKGMLIYTTIFIVINLFLGGIGWLWFFVLYYFYRSYTETKNFIANKVGI